MNAGFDKNEAEFGVLVFAVALEVLADGDGLVDTYQLPILSPKTQRQRGSVCKGNRTMKATFLINMYRSSGISGARPVM